MSLINPRNVVFYDDSRMAICRKTVLFGNIPDNYEIKPISLNKQRHCSQILAMHNFKDNNLMSEEEFNKYSTNNLALQYIVSAEALRHQSHAEKTKNSFNPNYFIPCAYLCRHFLELRIKGLLLLSCEQYDKSHDIQRLWQSLKESTGCDSSGQFDVFISELNDLDEDGCRWRYSYDTKEKPYKKESYGFDIDALVDNAEHFYNYTETLQLDLMKKEGKLNENN